MSHRFIHRSGLDVVVSADPIGGFYAVVPALPGCASQGESITETLENLDDAIAIVLQVMKEDDPSSLARIFASTTPFGDDGSNADSTSRNTAIVFNKMAA